MTALPRSLFIISALMSGSICSAQSSFNQLTDKAFKFFWDTKQYDSSLFYYQQASLQFPGNPPVYLADRIGDCYFELGDMANAEKYYLQCLSPGRDTFTLYSQVQSCISLSDIYYSQGKYREALTYLDYTRTKYRPYRILCGGPYGGYRGLVEFIYKRARCYYGLDKKDSAINELASYIFDYAYDAYAYADSSGPDEITIFFVNTVFEVYGVCQAGDELQRAVDNATYTLTYEKDSVYKKIALTVDCFIKFGAAKIDLGGYTNYLDSKEEAIPDHMTKEALLKRLTDSPAYIYIITGNDLPTLPTSGI